MMPYTVVSLDSIGVRMKQCIRLIILAACGLLVCPALAMTVLGLNAADVPITGRSPAALQSVLPQALRQVLVKRTGNPGVMTLPAIQNALPNLNQFVLSYSYHNNQDDNDNPQLFVRVRFDRQGIRHLIQNAGQPIWRADRPQTLVWLDVNDDQGNHVIASSDSNHFARDVMLNAKRRGVPVLLPAMDLQDQSFFNTGVSQPFAQKQFDQKQLMGAAKRYNVASVFAGNIKQSSNGQWQGQWLYLSNGQPLQWKNVGVNANAVIADAINSMANFMANQYAVIDNKGLQSVVTIEVTDVNNLDDYTKVVDYLKSVTSVADATVSDMQGSTLIIKVDANGGAQELATALERSRLLHVINVQAQYGADLVYQWQTKHPVPRVVQSSFSAPIATAVSQGS